MNASAWKGVAGLVDEAAGAGHVAPAVSLLVGRGHHVLFEHCTGAAGRPGHESACDETTVFDLASLTKPLVTVALTLDLIARGRLFFDTRVGDLVPAFAEGQDARRHGVSVRHLLRHDAGLPAYRRYFESFEGTAPTNAGEAAARRRRMIDLALAEPLERDPRAGSVYSDIGFLVLGAVVEEAGGARIDDLARERLFFPLGIDDAGYVDTRSGPAAALVERVAGTGPCPWRRGEVHGVVQDENAYAMGGVASHAGLFATARSVHRLVTEWTEAWAGRGLVLDRRIVGHAWNRSAGAAGAAPSTWALGWDTPTPGASSAGSRIGHGAVGHLGYTGTSIWIDPSRHAHVVLLTNRLAYGRTSDAIRALRPAVHDAVFAVLDRARA